MSDLPAGTDNGSDAGPVGEASSRPGPKRLWLGRLSTYLVSFGAGLTIDDLTGRLGYRGLAGAVALSGVVTAAIWIRGLDSRARVARYAPPLFLVPAGCAAGIAVFSSGSTVGISTAAAAVLTLGAVWVTKELRSAVRLLFGAVAIAPGAPVFVFGAAFIASRDVLAGAALITLGASPITFGAALIAGRDVLARAAVITGGATIIALGVTLIADRYVLAGEAGIAVGASAIAVGAAFIADRAMLAGGAVIAVGVALVAFGIALIAAGAEIIADPAMLTGAVVVTLGALLIVFQGSLHRIRASGHRRA